MRAILTFLLFISFLQAKASEITSANESHIPGIMAIMKQSQWLNPSKNIAASLQDKNILIFVAVQEETQDVIGFMMMNPRQELISSLAVDEKARRQGIGKKLIEKAKETTEGEELFLYVDDNNVDAINFYKNVGFNLVAEQAIEDLSMYSLRLR